ncbi:MAG: hypothetical protein ABSE73_20650 [Planctomycetota bacterium]
MQVNIRLGIWLDGLRLGIKAGLEALRGTAVEAIGLEAFGAELSPRSLSHTGRRELARFVRSKGASLAALRADVGGRRLADGKTLDANLQRLREAAQLACDVGAEHLVVAAGFVPPAPPAAGGPEGDAVARATLAEAGRALCALAASTRVRVSWLGGAEDPEVLAGFLNGFDSSSLLQLDLNPGAYVRHGFDPLKALELLASRVALATAADCYRGDGEAAFGHGDVRWGELFVGLSTLRGPIHVLAGCGLEGDRAALLTAAHKRLQDLRRNPMG